MDSNNIQEIELSQINWDNLSLEEFQALSQKVTELSKVTSKSKPAPKGSKTKKVMVTIKNENYEISEELYIRLIGLKSEKSKQNLIKQIQEEYKPIKIVSL